MALQLETSQYSVLLHTKFSCLLSMTIDFLNLNNAIKTRSQISGRAAHEHVKISIKTDIDDIRSLHLSGTESTKLAIHSSDSSSFVNLTRHTESVCHICICNSHQNNNVSFKNRNG